MLRLFLVLLIVSPLLAGAYGVVQWQTTERQLKLRSHFEPQLKLHFSGAMRQVPYLAMLMCGGIAVFAYFTGPIGGITVLMMTDVFIGCYVWVIWKGLCKQAQHEFRLRSAGRIGDIARTLSDGNRVAYAKYRRESHWLKGVKPPANRMSADDNVDYALRIIWNMVAERYLAQTWPEGLRRSQLRLLQDEAARAVKEALAAIEEIILIGLARPELDLNAGMLDWHVAGLRPATPTT